MFKPKQIIGDNYLTRWYLVPKNRFFNVYLHKFAADDDDRALHDHPWWSVSFLLKGTISELAYSETDLYLPFEKRFPKKNNARWLLPFFRSAEYSHRVILHSETAWTLFVTGPKSREWGFHCPKGWVHWEDFTDASGNRAGKGCG